MFILYNFNSIPCNYFKYTIHKIFTCNGNKEKSVKCVIFCGNRND